MTRAEYVTKVCELLELEYKVQVNEEVATCGFNQHKFTIEGRIIITACDDDYYIEPNELYKWELIYAEEILEVLLKLKNKL